MKATEYDKRYQKATKKYSNRNVNIAVKMSIVLRIQVNFNSTMNIISYFRAAERKM